MNMGVRLCGPRVSSQKEQWTWSGQLEVDNIKYVALTL